MGQLTDAARQCKKYDKFVISDVNSIWNWVVWCVCCACDWLRKWLFSSAVALCLWHSFDCYCLRRLAVVISFSVRRFLLQAQNKLAKTMPLNCFWYARDERACPLAYLYIFVVGWYKNETRCCVNSNFHLNLKWWRQMKNATMKKSYKNVAFRPAGRQGVEQQTWMNLFRFCHRLFRMINGGSYVGATPMDKWAYGYHSLWVPDECSFLGNKLNVSLLFWWHVKMILKPFQPFLNCVCLIWIALLAISQ